MTASFWLSLFLFLVAESAQAQTVPPDAPKEAFAVWAPGGVLPVLVEAADSSISDLRALASVVGNARVFGFGEYPLRAQEPLQFRNRLIRWLVSEQGFTAVTLPTGLATSRPLYAYVLGESDESDSTAASVLANGQGEYEANRALLRWLRAYNERQPAERKVRVYGFELEGAENADAARSIEAAIGSLARLDRAMADSLRRELGPTMALLDANTFSELPRGARDEASTKVHDFTDVIRRARPFHSAAGARDEYEWALRQATTAEQSLAYLRARPAKSVRRAGARSAPYWNYASVAEAENIQWIMDRERGRGKVFVFSSVPAIRNRIGDPSQPGLQDGFYSLGYVLKSILADEYRTMGTMHGDEEEGLSELMGASVNPVAALLSTYEQPAYVLDFRTVPAGPLRDWFGSGQPGRSGGSFRVSESFDAMLFIAHLTRCRAARGEASPMAECRQTSPVSP